MFLWLLQERCSRREQLEKGHESRDRRMFAVRTMLSLVTSRVPTLDGLVLSWRSQPWENRDRGTIILKNNEVVEKPSLKKTYPLGSPVKLDLS